MSGKLYVVGIGPGNKEHMSLRAIEAIEEADIVVGYKTYINILKDILKDKKVVSSGMRKEIDRCKDALKLAEEGKKVALVSSGDSGIYGMSGIMLEIIEDSNSKIEVEVIPGITSASAAASLLGAPVMHDFAVISLSDLLTNWELIKKRIEYSAMGDFVLCLYNPKSKSRTTQIVETRDILLKSRSNETPVGLVKNAMRDNQEIVITTLEKMLDFPIDMTTVVIIGNSKTYVSGNRIITPRGYVL